MTTNTGQRSAAQVACERCSASDCYHAGLHAGHVWTNVHCPAYVTRNGDDCICDPQKRETEHERAARPPSDPCTCVTDDGVQIPGSDPSCPIDGYEEEDDDEPLPIDLDRVCEIVRDAGMPAYVEQTGGGCATIYAGPKMERAEDPEWPRHAAAMGPGYFLHHPSVGVYAQARAWREECYIGPDDDGESTEYVTTEDLTDEQCAGAIIGLSVCTLVLGIWEGRYAR